jgi:hypothetical protein
MILLAEELVQRESNSVDENEEHFCDQLCVPMNLHLVPVG